MDLKKAQAQFEQDKKKLSAEDIYRQYLGKKGLLKGFYEKIKDIDKSERKEFGANLNILKKEIEQFVQDKQAGKKKVASTQKIDITRQPYALESGTRHPINTMLKQIIEIFEGMGFQNFDDTEVTDTYHCFDRLRTPARHPARDSQDTFFIQNSEDLLLRTQTTATQPKVLDTQKPPLRIISVGKVYRSDALDATHTPMFHQVDGFMVDKDISLANLKGILASFVRQFIPAVKEIRFRPHYFGYTEPSLELDMMCSICDGKGCKACKHTGWIEVLGAGMMHQELFTNAGYEWNEYTGFAFGFGLDRFVMQKYKIDDIRLLFENDMRLLKQIK